MALPESQSRRRFLRTLVAAGLVAPAVAQGAEESSELQLLVDAKGWGAAGPNDIRTVLLSAAGEIWRWCPGERLRPIRIYHRPNFPQTDFTHDWRGRIRIGLASQDTRWAQMSFQFGHEFIHTLAQHSAAARRAWRTPRHANLWFEECLCETASLFILRRLAARWAAEPPYPHWRNYAPELAKYAAERLARAEHQLPDGQSFAEWFRAHEAGLRTNPVERAKNVIVARQMLPLLEADPATWAAACYLNLGRRDRDKPRAQYFAEWQAASPAALHPGIVRIVALFSGA